MTIVSLLALLGASTLIRNIKSEKMSHKIVFHFFSFLLFLDFINTKVLFGKKSTFGELSGENKESLIS